MLFSKKNIESRNAGTRNETFSAASAYWMTRISNESQQLPFVMYFMPDVESGWDALAELPFMSRASDSGKLISDRLVEYGSYEYDDSGRHYCEAFISSDDISAEEFEFAAKRFEAHGGKLKNKEMPTGRLKFAKGPIRPAKKKEITRNGGAVYEVYTAPNRVSAIEYLRDHPVLRGMYYIIVETPEGNYGRDKDGMFFEK